MQFSTLFAAASVLAGVASATPISKYVKFTVESDVQDINNKGLSSTHEGAGVDYFFLGDEAQQLTLNTTSGDIYANLEVAGGESYPLPLNVISTGFPGLEAGGEVYKTNWSFEDGYLKGNGSDNFYVAKNTNDPYQYSKNQYQIGLFPENSSTDAFADVHSVKVKVQQYATA